MNTAEDDDLKLLRAAASRLSELEQLLPQLLHKRIHESNVVRERIRANDMYRIFALV